MIHASGILIYILINCMIELYKKNQDIVQSDSLVKGSSLSWIGGHNDLEW